MSVLGFVVDVADNVGNRGDTPNPNGSVHGKIEYMKDTMTALGVRQKPRGPVTPRGHFSTSSDSFQTALEVSGAGELIAMAVQQVEAGDNTLTNIRLTVDDVVVVSLGVSQSNGGVASMQYPMRNFYLSQSWEQVFAPDGDPSWARINFKVSLKIEIRRDYSNINTSTVYWQYVKE